MTDRNFTFTDKIDLIEGRKFSELMADAEEIKDMAMRNELTPEQLQHMAGIHYATTVKLVSVVEKMADRIEELEKATDKIADVVQVIIDRLK